MRDPKTTLTGVVAGLATLSIAIGVPIPEGVITGVVAIALFLMGLFAKDKK